MKRIFCGFILLLGSLASEPSPPCYALLIGINQYPKLAKDFQLDGCQNDVELFREMLFRRFAVPEQNISVLLNEQATREAILLQFQELLKKVKIAGAETQVIFFFSGHGSQVEDKNDDEEDAKDESLVTYNSTFEGEEDILDDDIESFLQELSQAQAHITVVLDCCHSGTGIRGNSKTRSLPRKFIPKKNITVSEKKAIPGIVFISACQPYEKTIEYHASNGKDYGLLTYHLVQALEKEGNLPTYRSIFKEIQSSYDAFSNAPTPTLEGDGSKFFLGRKAIATPKLAKVSYIDVEEQLIELDNGLFLGITEGSIFCLVPKVDQIPLTGTLEMNHLLVKVTEADCFQSYVRPLTGEERTKYTEVIHPRFLTDQGTLAEVKKEWDAIELIHNFGELCLKVYLEKETLSIQEDKRLISNQPLLLSALPASLQETLLNLTEEKAIELVSEVKEANAILRVGQKTAVLVWAETGDNPEIVGNESTPENYEPAGFGEIFLNDAPENAFNLEKALFQFNKTRNLLKFEALEEEIFNIQVKFVKIKKISRGKWIQDREIEQTKDGIIELAPKEYFGVLFENQSEEALYPTLMYIANDLEIQVLYPSPGEEDYKVYPQQSKLISLNAGSSKLSGREHLKLFVTTQPINLSTITMPRLEYKKNRGSEAFENVKKTILGQHLLKMSFGEYRKESSFGEQRGSLRLVEDDPQWTVKSLTWKIAQKK